MANNPPDIHSQPKAAPPVVLMDDAAVRRALMRIAHEVAERGAPNAAAQKAAPYLVGIPNGGVPLARQLARNLHTAAGMQAPVGVLDTTLYRDDLISSGARPALRPTEMPGAVDRRRVILVDDVLCTGRTLRAALDALMDFGRPQSVQVVALIDRGHREVPIRADYVGKNIPTAPEDSVQLRVQGDALELVLYKKGAAP